MLKRFLIATAVVFCLLTLLSPFCMMLLLANFAEYLVDRIWLCIVLLIWFITTLIVYLDWRFRDRDEDDDDEEL